MPFPWFQKRLTVFAKSIWRFCTLMPLYKRESNGSVSRHSSQRNPAAGKDTAQWDHLAKSYQRYFLG